MNILSLFGGAEQGRAVLQEMGITPTNYFSSEIDPYAIKLSSDNFSDIIHIGSVTEIKFSGSILSNGIRKFPYIFDDIDFLIGGPPCTNLSIAGKRQGLGASTLEEYFELKTQYLNVKNGNPEGESEKAIEYLINFFEKTQSYLFWESVRILREVKPKIFFIENVASMPKEAKEIISDALGVEPMFINSSLTSAQSRKRLYWSGVRQPDGTYKAIEIPQPDDKGILLKDILEDIPFDAVNAKGEPIWRPLPEKYITKIREREKAYCMTARYAGVIPKDYFEKGQKTIVIGNINPSGKGMNGNLFDPEGKCPTVTTNKGEGNKILGQLQLPHGNNTGGLRDSGKAQAIKANGDYPNNNKIVARIPEATKKGYCEVEDGDCVDMAQPQSSTPRGRLCKEKLNGLVTSPQIMHVREIESEYFWRKLTVRECARAQNFPESYSFDSISNSRAYKAIGNSWEGGAIKYQWTYLLPYLK